MLGPQFRPGQTRAGSFTQCDSAVRTPGDDASTLGVCASRKWGTIPLIRYGISQQLQFLFISNPGAASDNDSQQESPVRGGRKSASSAFAGVRSPVQLDCLRHSAGHPGHRGQGVGPGRALPALDGFRLPGCGGNLHSGPFAAHRACRGGCPPSHVHRCRIHTFLHNGGGGRRPGHPGQPGHSDRHNPAHHFQVGGHPAAHRHARGERYRHNDPVRDARVGGVCPDGRVVAGRSGWRVR